MLPEGDLVGDRYELRELLARGGMADVHRAEDTTDGRSVAVKMMRVDAGDARRFTREAQVLAALQHPNLVRLRDAGHHGGRPYFVMDLVEGSTLAARLAQGALGIEEVRRVGTGIAGALAYVHGRGVIHRDVKPSNILLDADGEALLSDFGVAWLSGGSRLTETTSTIGTAAFLAPEQVGGGGISEAVDVYALGLVLLESITGEHAFTGTQQEMLAARLARNPTIPPSLPASWRRLLRAMTARDPADRPDAEVVSGYLAAATSMAATPPPGPPTVVAPLGPVPVPPSGPPPVDDPDATLVMSSGDRVPAAAPAAAMAMAGGGPPPPAPPEGPPSRAPYVWMGTALLGILAAGFFLVASLSGDGSPGGSPASGDTTTTSTSTTTTTTSTTTTLPPTTLAPTTQPSVVNPPDDGDGDNDGDGRPRRRCWRLENQIEEINERLEDLDQDDGPLEQELREELEEAQSEYDEMGC